MVELEILGAKRLDKKLARLAGTGGKKVVRTASRKAMKPIHEESKNNARVLVGGNMGQLVAKNLILRALKKQRRGSYGVNIKLRADVPEFKYKAKNSKYAGGVTFIPAAIEYGHDNAAPIPFMRKAVDTKQSVAERVMRVELRLGLTNEALKN